MAYHSLHFAVFFPAERPAWFRWSLSHAAATSILVFGVFSGEVNAFLYFQF